MAAAVTSNLSQTPGEIGRANLHDVKIIWKDSHESVYPARFLRLKCACAGCVQEMTGVDLLDPGKIPSDVHPLKIELVGRYAIQIYWSDGHSTGIYTFDRLRSLCPCPACAAAPKKAA